MPRCPNKCTVASLLDISGVLPIVPTIMLIALSVSPFLTSISQSLRFNVSFIPDEC